MVTVEIVLCTHFLNVATTSKLGSQRSGAGLVVVAHALITVANAADVVLGRAAVVHGVRVGSGVRECTTVESAGLEELSSPFGAVLVGVDAGANAVVVLATKH